MFLNIMPVTSFLLLSVLLCSGEYLVHKKIAPDFICGKIICCAMGIFISMWAFLLFYSNLNYFIYQAFNSPITVLLRLLVVVYFFAVGFVLLFGGIGRQLYSKRHPADEEKFRRLATSVIRLKFSLSKIGLLFLVFYLLNYLFI